LLNYNVIKRNQKLLKFLNGTATALSLFIGSVIQLDLSAQNANWHPMWLIIIVFIKDNAPALICCVAVVILVTVVVLRMSQSATILKCVATKLDVIRDWLCCDLTADYNDNHRVTLFQYKKTYWGLWKNRRYWTYRFFPWSFDRNPWSGWLVPVSRSGYTSQKPKAIFWAPDDSVKSEGIAGVAWATSSAVHREKLPKITKSSSDVNCDKYCEITGTLRSVLESYKSDDKVPARSFYSFPILSKGGEPWGVVVIDSQSQTGILVEEVQRAVTVSCPVLAVLLEEL
jgi:hypothetical protein